VRAFRSFLPFSPVVVAFFVMLPRLLSPQFGLLDDGVMLRAAGHVSDNWTAAFTIARGSGRFFSSCFLFFYLVHALAGVHPLLFFAVDYAVFATTTAGVIGLVRLMGGTAPYSWPLSLAAPQSLWRRLTGHRGSLGCVGRLRSGRNRLSRELDPDNLDESLRARNGSRASLGRGNGHPARHISSKPFPPSACHPYPDAAKPSADGFP
jgi:hypothetical protein